MWQVCGRPRGILGGGKSYTELTYIQPVLIYLISFAKFETGFAFWALYLSCMVMQLLSTQNNLEDNIMSSGMKISLIREGSLELNTGSFLKTLKNLLWWDDSSITIWNPKGTCLCFFVCILILPKIELCFVCKPINRNEVSEKRCEGE